MERYQGVKFTIKQRQSTFSWDDRLPKLNRWAQLFSELGLAPLHPDGAYGNHSYRTGSDSFVITKSGMQPSPELLLANYCHVTGFDNSTTTFFTEGEFAPSSESFLHDLLYKSLPDVDAILHGHSSLLNSFAQNLDIRTTSRFHDYGTQELADSALQLAQTGNNFFILKDHGFVALGKDLDSAGRLTLDYFSELLTLLKNI